MSITIAMVLHGVAIESNFWAKKIGGQLKTQERDK